MRLAALKQEFQPARLLLSVTAGLIATIITISTEISLAALIFSGDMSDFLPAGIGLMLFGAFILGILITLTSSLPGIFGIPQDTPAAILALIGASIALTMKGAAPQAVYTTFLAAIALTTMLTGLFFLILGRFKLSTFVRYIPYPVIGGFLAGTGWLISAGAIGVMSGVSLSMARLPQLLDPGKLIMWLPGLIFAILLLLALRRWNHFLIMPGAIILAIAAFYGLLALNHISLADATARGWLLGPFPQGGLWQPLTPGSFPLIDWAAISRQVGKIGTILILSTVSLLLNGSALEIVARRDMDLNRELMSAGFANLVGGLGSSTVGYQALGLSTLAERLGARSRLANLISAALCGAAVFFGASVISFLPRPVLGAVLMFIGLSFLVEWLYDARKQLPAIDYVLIWVILVIIATVGFLEGIGAGIFISAILFVVNYSRINAIKNVLNGQVYRSKVDRPQVHRQILTKRGAQIYILRLQGFIFFGTVQSLLQQIRARIDDKSQPALEHLILDFQQVIQLDSSAVFGITRLKQLTQANSILMVWTHVAKSIRNQLERGGLVDETDDSFIILPTLDHGVEWAENKLLAEEGVTDLTGFIEKLHGQLKRVFPDLKAVDRLMNYLERTEAAEGLVLMR
ncbi:MAG TPA: SulP family inorganic anion transporter, partial [Anaerolineales bacterium]